MSDTGRVAHTVVRSKWKVARVMRLQYKDRSLGYAEVEMHPVGGGPGSENSTWSEFTPSGSIKMVVTQESAISAFKHDKEYYCEFIEAD